MRLMRMHVMTVTFVGVLVTLIEMTLIGNEIVSAVLGLRCLDSLHLRAAILAPERHVVEAEHVERRESRAERADQPDRRRECVCAGENLIL